MATYKGNVSAIEIEATVGSCNEDNSVNYVTSVSLTQDNNVTGVYNIGSRAAAELKEGNIAVTGVIERLWDSGWLGGIAGAQKFYQVCGFGDSSAQGSYGMIIYPAWKVGGTPEIQLAGVKFNNYKTSITVNDVNVESADFMAISVTIGTTTG